MDASRAVWLVRHALLLSLQIAAPALAAAAAVGLVVAAVGVPLRLQDAGVTTVARLVAVALVVVATFGAGAQAAAGFARHVWSSMGAWTR